jgi:hypothetical protein
MKKKSLFSEIGKEIGAVVRSVNEGLRENETAYERCDFFSSYETSYSVTLAYPDDILLESARRMGIATEGREKLDIVKEMFEKSNQKGPKIDEPS